MLRHIFILLKVVVHPSPNIFSSAKSSHKIMVSLCLFCLSVACFAIHNDQWSFYRHHNIFHYLSFAVVHHLVDTLGYRYPIVPLKGCCFWLDYYIRPLKQDPNISRDGLPTTCTRAPVGLPCCHVCLNPRARLNNLCLPPGQAPKLPHVFGPGAGSRAAVCPQTLTSSYFNSALPQGRLPSCHMSPDMGRAPCCYVFPDLATCYSNFVLSKGSTPEQLRVSGPGVGLFIITLSDKSCYNTSVQAWHI
jgi:hypothetical protein